MTFSTGLLCVVLGSLLAGIFRKIVDLGWTWLTSHIVWNPPKKA